MTEVLEEKFPEASPKTIASLAEELEAEDAWVPADFLASLDDDAMDEREDH